MVSWIISRATCGSSRVSTFSYTLWCIDWKTWINSMKIVKEGLNGPKHMPKFDYILLRWWCCFILRYLWCIGNIFSYQWLDDDVDKTKMMAIKTIQPKHYPTFSYKEEPIQLVESFTYLSINVLLIEIGGCILWV